MEHNLIVDGALKTLTYADDQVVHLDDDQAASFGDKFETVEESDFRKKKLAEAAAKAKAEQEAAEKA